MKTQHFERKTLLQGTAKARAKFLLLRAVVYLCIGGLAAHAQTTSPKQLKQDAIAMLQRTSTSDRELQKK